MEQQIKEFRKLKAYRELRGVKQTLIADLINVGQNTYGFKENGKSPFTLDEAKKIADYFMCTIEEIFFDNTDFKMNTDKSLS